MGENNRLAWQFVGEFTQHRALPQASPKSVQATFPSGSQRNALRRSRPRRGKFSGLLERALGQHSPDDESVIQPNHQCQNQRPQSPNINQASGSTRVSEETTRQMA